MTAHQRLIRDSKAALDPRAPPPSLDGYKVAVVHRDQALPIIMEYEWMQTTGRAQLFVGLLAPGGEVHGVVGFGPGPGNVIGIQRLLGGKAWCLERGACVHYAPPNAASFLINRACRKVHETVGVACFYAYADPRAGEYGAVYQAAGWAYLGQGLNGRSGRTERDYVLAPGLDPDTAPPQAWRVTRDIMRPHNSDVRMGYAEARARGFTIRKFEAKHVYATHVGPDRRRWRIGIAMRPYPAPEPGLKLKPKETPDSEHPPERPHRVVGAAHRSAGDAAAGDAGTGRDVPRDHQRAAGGADQRPAPAAGD